MERGWFSGGTSGSQILDRLVAFRPEGAPVVPPQIPGASRTRRTRSWSVRDIERLREATERGAHSLDELIPLFPDKSPRCVGKKFREVLQFESSRRPWTRDEDHQLLVWVAGHGKRWKEAEVQFRWRSEGHLRERYNALLAQQH